MDFINITFNCQPAYTWLRNAAITREGIHRQPDEMYDVGIRAFYGSMSPKIPVLPSAKVNGRLRRTTCVTSVPITRE